MTPLVRSPSARILKAIRIHKGPLFRMFNGKTCRPYVELVQVTSRPTMIYSSADLPDLKKYKCKPYEDKTMVDQLPPESGRYHERMLKEEEDERFEDLPLHEESKTPELRPVTTPQTEIENFVDFSLQDLSPTGG